MLTRSPIVIFYALARSILYSFLLEDTLNKNTQVEVISKLVIPALNENILVIFFRQNKFCKPLKCPSRNFPSWVNDENIVLLNLFSLIDQWNDIFVLLCLFICLILYNENFFIVVFGAIEVSYYWKYVFFQLAITGSNHSSTMTF